MILKKELYDINMEILTVKEIKHLCKVYGVVANCADGRLIEFMPKHEQ